MSAANLDPHLLATLDPEERAAFDPDPDLDAEALRAVAGDDDEEADDDADPDDENPSDDRDAKALAAADGPGPAPVEGKGSKGDDTIEDEDAGAPAPAPRAYEARLPENYDEQLQSIKDEDAALRQKFKDGEIDIDERDAGLAALTEKREALLVARTKAEIAGEMNQQTAHQQWQSEVQTFIKNTAKNEGVDYRKDEKLFKELDKAVKLFANDEDNNDKPMSWFLEQAHNYVRVKHNLPGNSKAPTTAAAPADPKKAAADKRKPDTSALPRTLADVPGADGPGDVASEFASLDSLDGEALEMAIARMNPAQRERYLRGE